MESNGRLTPSATVSRCGRSTACAGRALVLPDDADHDSLHDDVALVHAQGRHSGVGGLKPNPAPRLAVEPLDRGAGAVDQGDHHLAAVRLVPLLDDHEIAVPDLLVDHGVPAHLEHVAAPTA